MSAPVPGTALPWTALGHEGGHYTLGCKGRLEALAKSCQQFGAPADIQAKDMIYAAHACNNFPTLLEGAQTLMQRLDSGIASFAFDEADSDYQRGYLAALMSVRDEQSDRLTQAIASATGEA